MSITTHGPLFDRRVDAAVRDGLEEAQRQVAHQGAAEVRARLGDVLKHPTGRYESHVHDTVVGDNPSVVDDRVVYGPWLEGTGSRNRTTRFKGYHTFRLIAQRLRREAPAIADRVVSEHLRRLS
jgi:hypothetical protein